MSMDGQGTKYHRHIAENFNRLSRAHERYRQTTDGRAIAYSEREHEFTAHKKQPVSITTKCKTVNNETVPTSKTSAASLPTAK